MKRFNKPLLPFTDFEDYLSELNKYLADRQQPENTYFDESNKII